MKFTKEGKYLHQITVKDARPSNDRWNLGTYIYKKNILSVKFIDSDGETEINDVIEGVINNNQLVVKEEGGNSKRVLIKFQ
ncbi:hypothetical protein GNY06_12890 [Elizabethkingia argentiflava]|uniref:Lipocalin-like domain-containing protein n=1 Tax=Elizabethkingia argenteiflava TaxID=2681556 RepID=A0A845PY80_9FLAO|nr:hypothetical protein [Elizabethkingia argenteiflava]NAW52233.1 hypothetical protein [Elizabethkingia argenteiflava]